MAETGTHWTFIQSVFHLNRSQVYCIWDLSLSTIFPFKCFSLPTSLPLPFPAVSPLPHLSLTSIAAHTSVNTVCFPLHHVAACTLHTAASILCACILKQLEFLSAARREASLQKENYSNFPNGSFASHTCVLWVVFCFVFLKVRLRMHGAFSSLPVSLALCH